MIALHGHDHSLALAVVSCSERLTAILLFTEWCALCILKIQKDLLEKQRELELQRMTYGHGKVDTSSKVGEDEDEIVIRACAADIAIRIDKYAKDCRFEDVADKDRAKWKRRKDALFDFQDAVDDCLVTGMSRDRY